LAAKEGELLPVRHQAVPPGWWLAWWIFWSAFVAGFLADFGIPGGRLGAFAAYLGLGLALGSVSTYLQRRHIDRKIQPRLVEWERQYGSLVNRMNQYLEGL